jgi:GNAT superfamily N-acetyltransferase
MASTISVSLQLAGDTAPVRRLTDLINDVYAVAEAGLWRNGTTRTTARQLTELIAAGEIAVATLDGDLAGVVRVHPVSRDTGEFGMLAAVPEHRGQGVGRALVDFAEQHSREQGMRTMQLELLVPRTWRHPTKVYLDGWYRRIGYEVARTTSLDEHYPELAPLLATECDLLVYDKPLT